MLSSIKYKLLYIVITNNLHKITRVWTEEFEISAMQNSGYLFNME